MFTVPSSRFSQTFISESPALIEVGRREACFWAFGALLPSCNCRDTSTTHTQERGHNQVLAPPRAGFFSLLPVPKMEQLPAGRAWLSDRLCGPPGNCLLAIYLVDEADISLSNMLTNGVLAWVWGTCGVHFYCYSHRVHPRAVEQPFLS